MRGDVGRANNAESDCTTNRRTTGKHNLYYSFYHPSRTHWNTIDRLANFFWTKSVPAEAPGKAPPQDIMTEPPPPPRILTPQFCFSTVTFREFLRTSRSTIDDSITQNLNALLAPAREGFDPRSTSQREHRALSRRINPESCSKFKNQVLFPSWQTRSDVLDYCASVATSPDPDDPGLVSRQVESERDRERVVDDRLDPYSSRFFPRQARTERLAEIVRQERQVEKIIRSRTWGLVEERCGDLTQDWEVAMDQWRKGRERSKR